MPNLIYTRDIPHSDHNPSNDQGPMEVNTNSIDTLIAADHFSFNDNKGGRHKQVTLTNEAAPGFGEGNGVLYANLFQGQSWPFWQNGLGSTLIVGPTTPTANNGTVFLSGGIVIKWGTVSPVVNQTLTGVTFAPAFPTACFVVLVTEKRTASPNGVDQVYVNAKTAGNFAYYSTTNGVGFASFDWIAIGN